MRKIILSSAVLATAALATSTASAAFILELDASSLPGVEASITDNGAGDGNAASQIISYSNGVGTFDITVTIGLSNSPGSSLTPAALQITSLLIDNNASTTGTLTLRLGDTGFNNPTNGTNLLQSSVGGTFFGPAGSALTFTSFADDADTQFGTSAGTLPQVFGFAGGQGGFSSTVTAPFASTGTYSLTNVAVITLAPGGQVNISGTTSVIPEPTVLGLLAAGGLLALRRR